MVSMVPGDTEKSGTFEPETLKPAESGEKEHPIPRALEPLLDAAKKLKD